MTLDLTASTSAYRDLAGKRCRILMGLLLTLLALAVLSLCAGAGGMTPETLVDGLRDDGGNASLILWHIRVPRTLAAILAGSGLAMAGCVMQVMLRNPMASPSTLGVSQAAVFGANLAFIVFQSRGMVSAGRLPQWAELCTATGTAFAMAIADIGAVLLLLRQRGRTPETIVLAGIAMGAAFTAGTTLLQTFAQDTEIAAAVVWTFGDLGRLSQTQNQLLAVTVIAAAILFHANRWSYNALDAGETYARSLGINLRRLRMLSLLAAAFVCAVTVAFAGIIGFIGLVAPQLVRRFAGADHRVLLPCSALAGAALLLLADTMARVILQGAELPVGAITSLFGVPIFLALLLSHSGGARP